MCSLLIWWGRNAYIDIDADFNIVVEIDDDIDMNALLSILYRSRVYVQSARLVEGGGTRCIYVERNVNIDIGIDTC